jgi:hypothetical protein
MIVWSHDLALEKSSNPQLEDSDATLPFGRAICERRTATIVTAEKMNKFSIMLLVTILALCVGCLAFANETDFDDLQKFNRNLPGWKFARGMTNILTGPHELFAHMTNNAINGAYNGAYGGGFHGYIAGSVNGYLAGTGAGLYHMVKRMSLGCLDILTFWKPEYGPTTDQPFGTRSRAFENQDYFDKIPFWYIGPSR